MRASRVRRIGDPAAEASGEEREFPVFFTEPSTHAGVFHCGQARDLRRSNERHAASPVPAARADRPRRHGRDLPRRGRRARSAWSRSRCSASTTPTTRRPRTLHPRGAGGGAALERAEHGHDLRRRRARGTAVHRHGVPRGRLARRPAGAGGRAAARAGARLARADRGRARRRARERRRPSRRQAREPAARREGRVYVADFGVASATGLATFTEAGSVVGTAGYLAPEQAKANRQRPRATATRSRWSPSSCSRARDRSRASRRRPRRWRTSGSRSRGFEPQSGPAARGGRRASSAALAKDPDAALRLVRRPRRGAARGARRGRRPHAVMPARSRALRHAAAAPRGAPRRRHIPVLLVLLAGLRSRACSRPCSLAGGDDQTRSPRTTGPRSRDDHGARSRRAAAPRTVLRPLDARPRPPPPPPPPPGAIPGRAERRGVPADAAGRLRGSPAAARAGGRRARGNRRLVEAYASYNLAFTRFALGHCDGVLDLLERSKQVRDTGRRSTGCRRTRARGAEGLRG